MIKNGIMKAFYFVENAHKDQKRKLGHNIPYITHLKAVARYVEDYGGNEKQIMVALLHDVIEDYKYTETTLDTLKTFFDEEVVKGVMELSKKWICEAKLNVQKYDFHEKTTEEYYNGISEEMWLVKLCDRLHNAMFLDTDCPESGRIDFIYSYIRNTRELIKNYYAQKIENEKYEEIIKDIKLILEYNEMKWKKYHNKEV